MYLLASAAQEEVEKQKNKQKTAQTRVSEEDDPFSPLPVLRSKARDGAAEEVASLSNAVV